MEMRKNIKIVPGYRFGHLVVLNPTDQRKGSSIVWRCRCDCGKEILIDTTKIREERRTDCGCITKISGLGKDLAGRRFGKLLVLEKTDKRVDSGSIVWRCRCDCGKIAEVSARRLVRGNVKSCGCLSHPPLKDYVGKRFGRLTVIAYAGKLKETNSMNYWKCMCDCGRETIAGQTELQNGDTQSCGCYRKERIIEGLQLIEGTSVPLLESTRDTIRSDNKSGYTGVFWEKRHKKWVAKINFKKKSYWLGQYDDLQEAVRARQRGEEMRDNFLEWYYSEFRVDTNELAETGTNVSEKERVFDLI